MPDHSSKLSIDRRQIALAVLFILALYILVPQFSSFHSSWHLLRHPIWSWTLLGGLAALSTYFAAALTYRLLAIKRIRYREAVLVQLAAMFVNRLLPAGIGGLGANYAYLHHRRHTGTQAASVVGVNNALGLLGHGLIILIVLAVSSAHNRQLVFHSEHGITLTIRIIISVFVAAALIALIVFRKFIVRSGHAVAKELLTYKQHPWRLAGALLSSMVLTLGNILCLYSCMSALGIYLPFIVVILIFSFGLGAGTATPTPGGLGGFEAGLVAGFVAYHVASASALAIALLFRLISYWLALVIGAVAFALSQRQHLFES